MKKTYVSKIVAETFADLDIKIDMTKHEVVELKLSTCIDSKLQRFVRVEATVAPYDPEAKKSYKYSRDIDLPKAKTGKKKATPKTQAQ